MNKRNDFQGSDKRQNRNENWSSFSSRGWLPATGQGRERWLPNRTELFSPQFGANIHLSVSGCGIYGTHTSCGSSKPTRVLDRGQDQLPVLLWDFHCAANAACCCPLAGARTLPGHGALLSYSFHAEMVRIGFESKGCVSLLRHGMPDFWQ